MFSNVLVDIIVNIMVISLGIVARVSPIEGWKSARRLGLPLIIMGSFLLIINIIKLL